MNLHTDTDISEERAAAQTPLPPDQIAPHFPQLEILECLGRGGMGVVYKARQKALNRFVALKLLAPERVDDPMFAERFAREAQALAALNHPNIVTIHDFGQAGGFFYLLMEFVDGANLRHLLRASKFTPEQALAIVPSLCDALQFAHERGIVHRDIKPENILLDKAGRVKVADFGIAKMLVNGQDSGREQPGSPANATQSVVGTPGYSAPEQKSDPRNVDSRADIYSLGVVFYEMLTGELPGKKIEPPSRKVHIDVRLDEIVLRALDQKPELRYQQASLFKTHVESISASPDSDESSKPQAHRFVYLFTGLMGLLSLFGLLGAVPGFESFFWFFVFMGFFGFSVPTHKRSDTLGYMAVFCALLSSNILALFYWLRAAPWLSPEGHIWLPLVPSLLSVTLGWYGFVIRKSRLSWLALVYGLVTICIWLLVCNAWRVNQDQAMMQDISQFISGALAATHVQYDHVEVETSGDEIKAFVTQPTKLKEINGQQVSMPLIGTLVIHRTNDGWTVRGTGDLSDIAITRTGQTVLSGSGANGIRTALPAAQ